jgi:hypothetical protein
MINALTRGYIVVKRSKSVEVVLVTAIQQRRVCGAGSVLSAQGLGLAGFL